MANPILFAIWSASREDHLAIVGAHRLAWTMLNVGFFVATVLTAAGLAVLAGTLGGDEVRSAVLAAVAVTYAIAGGLRQSVNRIIDFDGLSCHCLLRRQSSEGDGGQ